MRLALQLLPEEPEEAELAFTDSPLVEAVKNGEVLYFDEVEQEEELDPYAYMPEYVGFCADCGGPCAFLGNLGHLSWGRCIQCGMTQSFDRE